MKKELKITLLLSLLGILVLIFIANQMRPLNMEIGQITQKNIGQNIALEARVVSIKEFPDKSFQILTIRDNSSQITATSNSKKMLNLNKTQTYLFIGKIEEYNQTLQLQLDKIESIN